MEFTVARDLLGKALQEDGIGEDRQVPVGSGEGGLALPKPSSRDLGSHQ